MLAQFDEFSIDGLGTFNELSLHQLKYVADFSTELLAFNTKRKKDKESECIFMTK